MTPSLSPEMFCLQDQQFRSDMQRTGIVFVDIQDSRSRKITTKLSYKWVIRSDINDTVETAGIIWRRTTSVAGRCQGIKLRFVCATNYGVPRRSSVIAGSLENRLELNNFNKLSVVLTCCKLEEIWK
jgi:hypothetical protein